MFSWKKAFWLLLLMLISGRIYAAIPSEHWKTLETEHFQIHFLPTYSIQAQRTALIAEKIFLQMQQRFHWTPEAKVSMTITDEYDSANGSATPYPYNQVNLRLFPPDDAGSLDDYDDWLTLLIEHELTHTFHTDKGRGKIIRLRNTFGRFLFFFPNILQPAWLIEGLATYLETHPGVGRGQSNSFEMLMREEVKRGVLPVSQVNLPPDSQPLSKAYLYGVYFYQFLHQRYGEQAIYALVENYSDNLLPFAINSNSKQVLGKNITELWAEFIAYLHQRFESQINALQASELAAGDQLYPAFMRPTQIEVSDNGDVFFIKNTQESEARLLRLQQGKLQGLLEVNPGSRFTLVNDAVYLAQPDLCDEYRFYYDLYRYDLNSGDISRLTECARYKHIVAVNNNNQLIAVATKQSLPQIDLLDLQGQNIKMMWQGSYGDVINSIDWSEERQTLLVSKKQLNQSWGLFEIEIETGEWKQLLKDQAANMQASYSRDQQSVLFSSDRTGVFNVYRYQIDNGDIQAMTNVVSGAFEPQENTDGDILYLHFNAEGYQLYKVDASVKQAVVLKTPSASAIRYSDIELESLPDYSVNDYSPWSYLYPKYWFPVFIVQDKGSEIGFVTSSTDALDHHYYELDLSYGVDQQELVGSLFYRYQNWLGLAYKKENALFSDNAGNTELIRTNTQMQIALNKSISSIRQRWNFKLGIIGNNDKDSYRASGISGFGDNYDDLLGISIYYDSKDYFLKSHSPEQGRDVLLVTESSDVFESDYRGQSSTLEWREFVNLGSHHVLALRYVYGAADATMRAYNLGGLETEWDDVGIFNPQYSRDIFNKRHFSLRGYQDNVQSGNNIEVLSVEYRFPLQQIERGWMTPPLGLIKHSGRLFSEAGASWNDGQQKEVISSAGLEWVMDANLFYFYNLQFRLGYAKGLDDGGDEFYYLKVGSAF